MTAGERALWAAVYAAAYVERSRNVLLGSQNERRQCVVHAACVASDALSGLQHAIDDGDLPVDVAALAVASTERRR